MSPGLTVVIPTFNEEKHIVQTLHGLQKSVSVETEIIVVDGGSSDGTLELLEQFDLRVIHSDQLCRAAQLDLGARAAQGKHLCFLHADTHVPEHLEAVIENVLSNHRVVLAGFVSVMRGERSQWLISFLNYVKTFLCPLFYRPGAFMFKGLRLLFGDQAMFCRRAEYLKSGGFDPEMKIMEEADLCLKMNQLGRIKQVHHFVYSSDRRVAELGLWKAMRIYIYVALGWAFGVSSQKLSARYDHIR